MAIIVRLSPPAGCTSIIAGNETANRQPPPLRPRPPRGRDSVPVSRAALTRFAWISIVAAILTMGLKTAAYYVTGSVGLLSDAIESLVNLAGGIMALAMLTVAARPPDEDHAYGHGKAEYFSSGVEGTLILIAAVSIWVTAVQRLITPRPLEAIGMGLAVSVAASPVICSPTCGLPSGWWWAWGRLASPTGSGWTRSWGWWWPQISSGPE